MNKILKNTYLTEDGELNLFIYMFRFIIGCVFIYASIDKINDPRAFSDLIDNFHVSPILFSNLIALILPWIELLCGICLITGIMLNSSIIIIMILLIWFIFILCQAIIRGIDTHCGCFKVDSFTQVNYKFESIMRVIEDIILLLISFVVYKNNFNLRYEKNVK